MKTKAELQQDVCTLNMEVEQLKAQIAAHDVASVPDGFVMVPVEPTDAMKLAGNDELSCDYCGALTEAPWHGSGEMHGKENRHIHACDNCRDLLPKCAAPFRPGSAKGGEQ